MWLFWGLSCCCFVVFMLLSVCEGLFWWKMLWHEVIWCDRVWQCEAAGWCSNPPMHTLSTLCLLTMQLNNHYQASNATQLQTKRFPDFSRSNTKSVTVMKYLTDTTYKLWDLFLTIKNTIYLALFFLFWLLIAWPSAVFSHKCQPRQSTQSANTPLHWFQQCSLNLNYSQLMNNALYLKLASGGIFAHAAALN